MVYSTLPDCRPRSGVEGKCPPLASQSTRPTLTNCRIVHGPTPSCPHLLLLLLLLVIAHPVQQAQHAMLLQGDSCRYGDN